MSLIGTGPLIITRQFKIAFGGALRPCPHDIAASAGYVLNLALGDNMDLRARAILHIRFEVDSPGVSIESRVLNLGRIQARIYNSGQVFAVPTKDDRHIGAVFRVRSPVAVPASDKRVTLLRK